MINPVLKEGSVRPDDKMRAFLTLGHGEKYSTREIYHVVDNPTATTYFFGETICSVGLSHANLDIPNALPFLQRAAVIGITIELWPKRTFEGSFEFHIMDCTEYRGDLFGSYKTVKIDPPIPIIHESCFRGRLDIFKMFSAVKICAGCGVEEPRTPCEYCGKTIVGSFLDHVARARVGLTTIFFQPRIG